MNDANRQLSEYSAVTTGAQNAANGQKNVILGNYNKLEGNHNWVLVDNFNDSVNGSLLINKYIIELNMTQYFIVNPKMTMSPIYDAKNKSYKII